MGFKEFLKEKVEEMKEKIEDYKEESKKWKMSKKTGLVKGGYISDKDGKNTLMEGETDLSQTDLSALQDDVESYQSQVENTESFVNSQQSEQQNPDLWDGWNEETENQTERSTPPIEEQESWEEYRYEPPPSSSEENIDGGQDNQDLHPNDYENLWENIRNQEDKDITPEAELEEIPAPSQQVTNDDLNEIPMDEIKVISVSEEKFTFCDYCGAKLPPNSRFCSQCGAVLG